MKSFKIFTLVKNNIFNIDLIISLSFIVSISLVFLINKKNEFYYLSIIFLIINLITIITISLINNFRYQKLNGKFDGELIFLEDKIILDKTTILISDIKNIYIHIEDYKGKYLWRKTLKPKLQQGVKNFIKIELLNENTIVKYFLQNEKNEIIKISNILEKYYLNKKIHFLHLIELLGINDYDEIQKIKIKLKN
ncbi:hypothetical protein [Wenyingzhuangia aestuarii]|uniref:hypothetical protein n=1 Tax=Wenyingzhuangia aestuarii TaxID=1647582 RepID=UPI001439FF1D|nr:hypothetical protein [Wenyingzhuangia aestuarii]NJB84222.1 hypothetical protein [Wenyingzhuangia aestuarii]